MHTFAAMRANESNNVHSLAVQMRVVLECAAQVQSKAYAAHEGSEKAAGEPTSSDSLRVDSGKETSYALQVACPANLSRLAAPTPFVPASSRPHSPSSTPSSNPLRTAQTTTSCFESMPSLSCMR